jgi:hypothetical protein
MRQKIFSFAAAALLVLPLAAAAQSAAAGSAGTASGTFSVDGKSVQLKYAYAMTQPNTFDEKKTDTAILLTDKPVPDADLAAAKELGRAVMGGAGRNAVLFEIDESGRAMREVVRHESLGEASLQMSGMTHADVKLSSRTGGRVEGTAETKEPEDFVKHKYAIHAKFSAPVRAARRDPPAPDAKTGKKLPKGGGEPGKAYLSFEDMIRRKDVAGLRKLKPAGVADMTDEDLKAGLELMAAMTPEKIAVDDGYIDGDQAVLYVSGMHEGKKQYATVRMQRSDGVWRPADQKWSDKPPEK